MWKPIKGFEGVYEVSITGLVCRCGSAKTLKPQPNSKGYARVFLYNGSKKGRWTIHHLVAEAFVPNPKKLPHINHKDGNKKNNRADNLEWCDVYQNNAHAKANGLYKPNFGSKHGMSELTEKMVLDMRKMANEGKPYNFIASVYSVHPSTARRAIIKQTWKHL